MILADGRWSGEHGIGRFSREILSRLKNTTTITHGPSPLSLKNLFWQPYQLYKLKKQYKVFFTPGFNPVLFAAMPYVLTIHDLIHLRIPGKFSFAKKIFYEIFIKPSVRKARCVITISEYSKKTIEDWTGISSEKIQIVPCGVSPVFTREGEKHCPGFPYLLHVGNTKPHKNTARVITAFAKANISPDMRLYLAGEPSLQLTALIKEKALQQRVIFTGKLTEEKIATYYRGASALVFPSLYEGFGLPVLEAMACGTPVLTSNTTSLPEAAGDAALMVDPYDVHAIATGIEKILADSALRELLIEKGLARAKLFSWDETAVAIQNILAQCHSERHCHPEPRFLR